MEKGASSFAAAGPYRAAHDAQPRHRRHPREARDVTAKSGLLQAPEASAVPRLADDDNAERAVEPQVDAQAEPCARRAPRSAVLARDQLSERLRACRRRGRTRLRASFSTTSRSP
jgi:hypothetical protein